MTEKNGDLSVVLNMTKWLVSGTDDNDENDHDNDDGDDDDTAPI